MKKNDTLHGFTVKAVQTVSELEATLYQMEHDKSGARLIWLDRDEENKTFCIAFRTIPSDDTGVFHILEHSVLCGSDRYPVKEPFLELMKSSLNTFLNALTGADGTYYPVSSRNDKDFLNLTRVYMDAVLHPLIYSKPEIFHQEGWHYEMPKDGGVPAYKGVVFNEMKGAYSSPDRPMWLAMSRQLFPDSCYGYESGGHPKHIPELTYEQFLDNHRTFYHPSNSYIYLDGKMNIDEVLSILDGEYLAAYDRRTDLPELTRQDAVSSERVRAYYEISPDEDAKGKSWLAWGRVFGNWPCREDIIAMHAIADALCGGSQSPLKQKILSHGLGQDVRLEIIDDCLQPHLLLGVVNMDETRADEVNAALREELERLVREGLDHQQLEASLANREFEMRERDYGWAPQGLGIALNSVMPSWFYTGDPAADLEVGDLFVKLNQKLKEGYFEKLLERVMLRNPHGCEVLLLPSATLGTEQREAEAKRLEAAAASWSEEDRAAFVKKQEILDAWQASTDSPEALASIPALRLSDIPDKPEDIPTEMDELGEVPLLRHKIPTGGIGYVNLYFDVTDLEPEQLSQAAFLCALLGELDTDRHSALELQRLRRLLLGRLECTMEPCGKLNAPDDCRAYLSVSFSALESKLEQAVELVADILTGTSLASGDRVRELLRQLITKMEQKLTNSGNRMVATRTAAGAIAEETVRDYAAGISWYQWLKAAEKDFDSRCASLLEDLAGLRARIFSTGRLTAGVTGLEGESRSALERVLLPKLPASARQAFTCPVKPWGVRKEGLVIPAGVSYAAIGGDLRQCGAPFSGTVCVADRAVSLEYLWNVIRVQGGAYGTGLWISRTGGGAFHSYRDPNAARSLEKYREAAAFLRDYCAAKPDLTGIITGTVAEVDPLLPPSRRGRTADLMYLRGVTYADRCREQQEILSATWSGLAAAAEALEKLSRSGSVCVLGSKAHVDACGGELESVITL